LGYVLEAEFFERSPGLQTLSIDRYPPTPCYDWRQIHKLFEMPALNRDMKDVTQPPATVELLRLAKAGDRGATNALFERLFPPLLRFARGRLPGWARGMIDTTDLVQETLLSAYGVIGKDQAIGDGAIHAYLRATLKNRLIDELRKVERRPRLDEMDKTQRGNSATPLEELIGIEALERYEDALGKIPRQDRDAVLARIELGLSYAEIARMLDRPSADAARMSVSRAMLRLARAMSHE
ncbi:MAG TPA: RNA polymerase sigma factor, partial [Rhodocyclaceae bacterium]